MVLVELTTVAASDLPISELSDHLRLGTGFTDDGSQNAVLESYLRAALGAIEARIGKALMEKSLKWQLTAWRDPDHQALPIAPVSVITSVTMIDRAGIGSLADPSRYYLEQDSQRPVLRAVTSSLPTIPEAGLAELVFLAGYGPLWAAVPVDLRQAVLLLAAHYFEHRGGHGVQGAVLPFGVMALIEPYHQMRLLGGGK